MPKILLVTLAFISLFPLAVFGQSGSLFESVDYFKATQSELQIDELDRVYIRFADGLFKSTSPFDSEALGFEIGDEIRAFSVTKRAEYFPGVYSVIAKEEETGSIFIATIQGNRFTAKLHDHLSATTRHIRYDESLQQHYVSTLNIEALDILGCALDDHSADQYHSHSISQKLESNDGKTTSSVRSKSSMTTSIGAHVDAISTLSSLEDKTTIDILYVYTDAAQDFAESCKFNGYRACESITTIEAYLAQATILSQSAFDNSDIAIELRPVYNYKVDYDETADDCKNINPRVPSNCRLKRFTTSTTFNPSNWNAGGYMDDVHEIRDEVGADMVAGIFNLSDVGGIAWLLGSPMGFPELAFSLNRIQQILTGYTLAHELGHNLGNAHSRSQESNAADLYGALFHYSVGYQWVTENEAFVSVMGYGEDKETLSGDTVRTQEAGVFSSPDVLWQGVAAGTLDPLYGPTDASKSNKEIKLTIADYRPTVINPPSIVVDQEAITVSMNREDQFEVPLTISNTGASNLMWRVATEPVELAKSVTSTDSPFSRPDVPIRSYKAAEQSDDKVVYSEGFEGFKSSLIGYPARQGWRTQSQDNLFAIKTNNPSLGEQHFQIRASKDSTYWVQSPFFGPQLEGTFDISFDISVTKDRDTDGFNYVDLRFYDAVEGNLSAGIAINSDLEFQTFNRAEVDGAINYVNTGEFFVSNTAENDSYRTVRIKLNSTTSRIEYYIDGVQVDESRYLNADVLDVFYVMMNGATHPLGLVDIDNIQIRRPYLFEWLDIDDVAGAIDPGEEGTVTLSFNTVGIEAGVYQTKLQILNNSLTSKVLEIPVTLSVSTAVSNEDVPFTPSEFRLRPAYPNPFNPETTLSFELPEASIVTMEVYDVLGRKIQTLANESFGAGTHSIKLDATPYSSGLYMIRMQAGRFVATQHVTLIK